MRLFRVSAAALLAAAVAAGCGDESDGPRGAKPVGLESAGSVVQFVDCADWRAAGEAERYATIRALRGQLTPQRSTTAASPLPDEHAFAKFNKTCATPGAESLRLYKLYVRMQGFAPLAE